MDQDKKITILTEELNKTKIKKKGKACFVIGGPKDLMHILINTPKETEITIYDITNIKKKPNHYVEEVFDHINQSGENWLRGMQKKTKKDFIDITNLYVLEKEKKVITTSLGKYYQKNKEKVLYPSTDLCNIAIMLKGFGYINIKGRLINCKV